MAEKFHFWSDIPGDKRASDKGDADKHASNNQGASTEIQGIEHLKIVFRAILKANTKIEFLDFHTHGSPGRICLGAESLSETIVVVQLGQEGLDALFSANASIIFNGCNVGEGYQGEYFLALFAAICLRTNAGAAAASTGFGLADPLFTGDVFHPTGTWVSANVAAGRNTTLVNHQHLDPAKIRARIKDLQARINNPRDLTKLKSMLQLLDAAQIDVDHAKGAGTG